VRPATRSLALCWLLMLVGAGPLLAQDRGGRPFSLSADEAPAGPAGESPYHLLPDRSLEAERWLGSEQRLALAQPWSSLALNQDRDPERSTPASWFDPRFDRAETEVPRWSFLERHQTLFSVLLPITSIGAVTANSLVAYNTNHSFRVHEEGWFGKDTTNGGADKASHLTDYYVTASLLEDAYKMIGYSENKAILAGVGLAIATGLANELSDGVTRHGFSWEDLAMDSAGALAAGLVSVTHTRDLFSMRTSHLPSSSYTHDVYSADFKFSGLARRLGVNLGPLRWLLFSVTYGAKGYRVTPAIEQQRQLGFEVGLNVQQILFDLRVPRSTWWGYALHVFGDNLRLPFTAVGMRVDLNRGRWHGPNNGNYD